MLMVLLNATVVVVGLNIHHNNDLYFENSSKKKQNELLTNKAPKL